jgi:serine/threonine protein phosphatase 1
MPVLDRMRRLFRGGDAPPEPDRPLYLIGDIHGRADLLQRLFELIDADQSARGLEHPLAVFLGDYVDRGADSRRVLHSLHAMARSLAADPAAEGEMLCLMGNHERMMLDFLDTPLEAGPRWLRNGGVQTLESFGLEGVPETAGPEVLEAARDALAEALGMDDEDGLAGWLRELPLIAQSGNIAMVHAGCDPSRAIDDQRPGTLLWGHPEFLIRPRRDGLWVAHGHTVVSRPAVTEGRIALDTGAWFSDRLTAAILVPGEPVRFLST